MRTAVHMMGWVMTLACAGLAACGSGSAPVEDVAAMDPATLCVASACGILSTVLSVPDDLSPVGADLLLALHSEGAVAMLGADGSIVSQTDPLSFELPSSVKTGRPPLFAPTDLAVTEEGVVGVPQTGALFGNALSVFRRNP